jgi:hypothetical protein
MNRCPCPISASFRDSAERRGMNGLAGTWANVLSQLGLKDPIAHYEPGMPLPAVWTKYRDQVDRYRFEVEGLRSETRKKELRGRVAALDRMKADLEPAFRREGATVGEREKKKLGELVLAVRKFRTDFNKAKKEVGWTAPDVAPEEGAAPPAAVAPVAGGIPTWALLLAAGLAAVFILQRK